MNAPFSHDEITSRQSEIDVLADADDPCRSFLRASWFQAGEEPATSVVTARDKNGSARAAFPLRAKAIGPVSINQIAGAYWPFRGCPVDRAASAEALAEALEGKTTRSQLGNVWRMGPVVDDDPALDLLKEAAKSAGWHILSRPVGSLFVLDLVALTASGNWPSSKGQQKDRWRVRQLEKTGPVNITHFTGDDWTSQTRDAIAEIEANSWVGKLDEGGDTKFLDPSLRTFWEGVAKDPAIAAMIRGSLLHVGDTPAAFTFGLDCGDTRYCVANNFDQQFHKFSPGRILLYDDFTSAAARGLARIDWGLGDGGYKRQMGAEECSTVSDLLFVRGAIPAALLRRVWQR
ncbi:GNAT family N-acetyltransferase [uncultured Erythrobacter sp.]|uniref:GNAT family N-acetyltransferase n=1 Tax=uncultured Erythrobacter sp. TaxID=263913 RepID=UPI002634DC97|nr:GNAT family N-acetyltransferase [uncultured Erythrobacter sp.]